MVKLYNIFKTKIYAIYNIIYIIYNIYNLYVCYNYRNSMLRKSHSYISSEIKIKI